MRIRKMLTFLFVFVTSMLTAAVAFAEGSEAAAGDGSSMKYLAAALAIGLAAAAGSIGQSRAAAAALEGIARNPNAQNKIFTPMILGLALIESLVIYALIIALLLIL
jgi:F-type H+-transporting ATPase subunit c